LDENLIPAIVRVDEIRQETPDIRSFRLVFENEELREGFRFKAGQFCLISVFGTGEAAFSISSAPAWRGFLEISVKDVGKVTSAMHDLEVGDRLGFRGPYGNAFDLEKMRGRGIVFAGGGVGLAPLRPPIWEVVENRQLYGEVCVIYGGRSVADIGFRSDLERWEETGSMTLIKTVDPGGEDAQWKGEVGLVPAILEKAAPPADSILITCGPPVMIKYVMLSARKMGFKPADVFTTLEMKMKCGVGLCGRCNVGSKYVCRDGPVFSLAEVESLPDEF
jgi:sulfhydrogenase subunit gamma (sulfur reductase)